MVMTSSAPAAWRMSSIDSWAAAMSCLSLSHWRVGEVGDRQAVAVGLVGEGDPILGLRQELAQRAEGGPVHVVAHVFAQRRVPSGLALRRARPR